ncbi:MAG TPA: hypothetical protein VJL36_00135 [Candidatus Paceibacterota bacterium]
MIELLPATSYQPPIRGFMALVTVVIIAAAALVMSLNSLLLGLGALDIGYLADRGDQAAAAADGCAEEALGQLRVNPAYLGAPSPGLSVFGGSCIIEVLNLGGTARQINVSATIGDFTKQLAVTVTLGDRFLTVNSLVYAL